MGRIAVSISHESEFRRRHRIRSEDGGRPVPLPARHRRNGSTSVNGSCSGAWSVCERCTVRRRGSRAVAMPTKTVPETILLDDAIAAALLPARPVRGHKGTFGKLLVIAGSVDYAGAALLVCNAAGRAGAGLVTLASVESLQAALRRQGHRGNHALAARRRRRGSRSRRSAGAHPRPRPRRPGGRPGPQAEPLDDGPDPRPPGRRRGRRARAGGSWTRRRCGRWPTVTAGPPRSPHAAS